MNIFKLNLRQYILIGILLVNIITTLHLYYNKKNNTKSHDIQPKYKEEIANIRDSLELFTLNNKLNNYIIKNNNRHTLKSLINNKTLIYRFNQFSCNPCVENDINIIKQLADSIGRENILIIPRLKNIKILRIYISNFNINLDAFNFQENFPIPIEESAINDSPYFIVLDKGLNIKFAYTSSPSHSICSPFFRRMISYFNTE